MASIVRLLEKYNLSDTSEDIKERIRTLPGQDLPREIGVFHPAPHR
jgi:hypothetical protein